MKIDVKFISWLWLIFIGFDYRMAVSVFKSSSKRGTYASPSTTSSSTRDRPIEDSGKKIPLRRSRSIVSSPRSNENSTSKHFLEYANTRDNPLFGCTSPSPSSPEAEYLSEAIKNDVLDCRRGRSLVKNSNFRSESTCSTRERSSSRDMVRQSRIRSPSRGQSHISEVWSNSLFRIRLFHAVSQIVMTRECIFNFWITKVILLIIAFSELTFYVSYMCHVYIWLIASRCYTCGMVNWVFFHEQDRHWEERNSTDYFSETESSIRNVGQYIILHFLSLAFHLSMSIWAASMIHVRFCPRWLNDCLPDGLMFLYDLTVFSIIKLSIFHLILKVVEFMKWFNQNYILQFLKSQLTWRV